MMKHGIYKDGNRRFANIYYHMKDRCNNINNERYNSYGGRGIKCLWDSLQDFYEDMYKGYLSHCKKYGKRNTTLDRVDNDGDYCKENCRRATRKEQDFNKRQSLRVKIGSIDYNVENFAKAKNINVDVARRRIKEYNKGSLSYEELIHKGLKHKHGLTIGGLYYTYEDIARITGATRGCIDTRIYRFRKGDISEAALFKKV